MELPTRIILTSGIGIGSTKLNAFDNALLNAGIGNFNLLSVSSIIPPKAKIIYLTKDNREKLLPEIGSIVPIVYSCVYGEKLGERIVAILTLVFLKITKIIMELYLNLLEIILLKIEQKKFAKK